VLEKFIAHAREVNYQGFYYMCNYRVKNKKAATEILAAPAACASESEELIITRNNTESLDMVIIGLQ
jgi:hypothetical protein